MICVGAGIMGAQIGAEYALAGYAVVFLVRRPEVARQRIDQALADAARHGLVDRAAATAAQRAVTMVTSVDDVATPVALVVESVPEDLATKVEVLGPVARALPDAVIASNTSSLRIADLGVAIGAPERTVGAHYFNPPLLTPLVEVIASSHSSRDAVDLVCGAVRTLGKRPVLVEREVPGFVWNRLQFALLREALWLVDQGVADAETIDDVVQSALARRWSVAPPFKSAALGGVETFIRSGENIAPTLSAGADFSGLRAAARLDAAEAERLAARRDAVLAEDRKREAGRLDGNADRGRWPGP